MKKEQDYELKIHLKLNEKNDPACGVRPSFNPKYVSSDPVKINCTRCCKIVKAILKSGLAPLK